MACYRDQQNSVHAQARKQRNPEDQTKPPRETDDMKKLHWADRHSVLNLLMKEREVVLEGTDLPDPEDPSDPEFTATIVIANTGAGTETFFDDKIIATGIPSLMVPSWTKESLSYLKHWLFKVFDDPRIYRAKEIRIQTTADWQKNFKR